MICEKKVNLKFAIKQIVMSALSNIIFIFILGIIMINYDYDYAQYAEVLMCSLFKCVCMCVQQDKRLYLLYGTHSY